MIGNLIYTESEIQSAVQSMALKIGTDYKDENPILIGVLKGSYIFLSDLSRALGIDHTIDFIAIDSYGMNGTSQGEIRLLLDTKQSLEKKDVIIVEDIIDSGNTITYIRNMLAGKGTKSIAVCSLLVKKKAKNVDYYGFKVDDRWVVGYGLDYKECYRDLNEIYEYVP